ncbi:MAG: DUF4136 domain-containing protein [Bacteroidota bacterium]
MKNFLIPIVLVFLVSCSSLTVTNNWDKTLDFKQFKTFSLYPWDKQNNKLVHKYDIEIITTAVKSEMERRGYEYVEKGGELIVSAFITLENKTDYQAYTNHYGGYAGYGGGWGYYGSPWAYGYGWGPGYYGGGTTITSVNYVQGTLIVDIFETKNKKLVWQGMGVGTVDDNLAKRDKNLPRNISHIFRKFPIAKKGK